MKLIEISEPLRPFRCPACKEYLTTDIKQCRFCGIEIDQSFAETGAQRERLANRLYRKRNYSKHLVRGSVLFAIGVVVMIGVYLFFLEVLHTDFVWIPRALVIGGGGDALYGIYGLVSEAQNAKQEMS